MIINHRDYKGVTHTSEFVSTPPGFKSKIDARNWMEEWDIVTAWLRGDVEGFINPITNELVITRIIR